MRTSTIALAHLAILLAAAVPAPASVLCSKKNGVVVVRTACKAKETALDPVAMGLKGPQGDEGIQGPPGQQGPGAEFAVVAANATIVAQSGGITVSLVSGVIFALAMPDDVSGKTIQITNTALTGDTGLKGPITYLICGTAPTAVDCTSFALPNDNKTILVATTNTSASNELHAFSIAVF